MDVRRWRRKGFVGEVLGNLNARNANIQVMDARIGEHTIRAYGHGRMFGYATDLAV
jgi:translation elongation factor EF-G